MALKIVDSYGEENHVTGGAFPDFSGIDAVGQSFTGDGSVLGSVRFYLKRYASPTGALWAEIYGHSGIFGSSSKPNTIDDPITQSDIVNVPTLLDDWELVTFNFSGGNRITLANGTKYVVVLNATGLSGDSNNQVLFSLDNTSPSHDGNMSVRYGGAAWSATVINDLIFYVYGVSTSPLPAHFNL